MSARRQSTQMPSAGFRADLWAAIRDHSKHTSAGHKRAVLLLIVAGAALRAALLNRPIGYDEAYAFVEFGTRSVSELTSSIAHPANQILHTLLTKCSTWLFGVGPIQLRLPAFLAGVAVMPLFYFFVRAMFNRYIALLTLALVAASGPLVEHSAMARGYSLTWCCMMLALVLGRHLIKSNSVTSAFLIGVVCTLAMWTLPASIFIVLFIYIWLLISLTIRYEHSLRPRINLLLISVSVFLLSTVLLYIPVIRAHGIDQLVHHPSVPYLTWKEFKLQHDGMAFQLWAYIVDSSAPWLAILGLGGLVHAAFVSSKFRTLGFALVLGAVPLVLFLRQLVPVEDWLYALFVFHLSSGIALFYLLKFVQEKLIPSLGKRARTLVTSGLLFVGFAMPGMRTAMQRTKGLPEAARAVEHAQGLLKPGDKLYAIHPWDAPIEFQARAKGLDLDLLRGPVAPGGRVLVAFSPDLDQHPEDVLRHYSQDPAQWPTLHMVQDWSGLKIFAAP